MPQLNVRRLVCQVASHSQLLVQLLVLLQLPGGFRVR
jgi:hypothetical protein